MQRALIKSIILLFGMTSFLSVFGQKEEINYAKYKKEIGIDFQGIFTGGGPLGTAIIFKLRKPETGLIAVNEKTAYRFKVALNGSVPIGKTIIDSLASGILNFLNTDYRLFSVGVSVGLERQINRKRLQYSYGLDLGYNYTDINYVRYYRISSSQSGKIDDLRNIESSTSHGPSLTPFFGFKYFILPEISVSVESGLLINFNFIHLHETEQILPDQEIETIQKSNFKELGLYFDYLRALNLSYYF